MKDIDVLCIGVTSYDLVFSIDHHPQADEKSMADALTSCGGGPAANAAVTVAHLGLKSALCAYLGDDILGNTHLDELHSAQVNTDFIIRGKEPTPLSVVLVKPNGERSLVNYRSSKPIKADTFKTDFLNPKVILFDGHEPEISDLFLAYARGKNIPTILDAGSVNPGTRFLYDKVDYLVCSEVFAREMTTLDKPQQALQELARYNKNIVLTMGEKGLLWKTEHDSGQLDGFPVKAVDTTGAGDVFHGAFASCLTWQKTWQETLIFASAAAALSCTRLGARTSIPLLSDVESFLQQQKK